MAFRPILGRGAPTLLIVGGSDEAVLRLNRQARQQLTCESKLTVIPGAAHLFEEPGALEQVAELAIGWFTRYLVPQAAGTVRPAWPLFAGAGPAAGGMWPLGRGVAGADREHFCCLGWRSEVEGEAPVTQGAGSAGHLRRPGLAGAPL